MAISKIILNGVTQMDLTADTVAANNLIAPNTAHGADGEAVVGTASGGGGGNVAAINILDGVGVVPGYLGAGGDITAQNSTRREITTDYIDVSGHLGGYIYTAYIGSPGPPWFAFAFYDSSHSMVGSRTTYYTNGNDVLAGPARVAIPASGVKYARISFRTYGHAAFAAAYEPLIDAMTADGWSSYQSA